MSRLRLGRSQDWVEEADHALQLAVLQRDEIRSVDRRFGALRSKSPREPDTRTKAVRLAEQSEPEIRQALLHRADQAGDCRAAGPWHERIDINHTFGSPACDQIVAPLFVWLVQTLMYASAISLGVLIIALP
jgi:hypothetical protein